MMAKRGLEAKRQEAIGSVEELMAHALAIEVEAEERYRELAAQMEMHNNREVASLFRKLAAYESAHAREIESRVRDMTLPSPAPWEFKWPSFEAPEQIDTLSMHYLMSPQTVLALALDAERRAFDFFSSLAARTTDPAVSDLAMVFAAEEEEHVRMVEEMLARMSPVRADWDDDPDMPTAQG